MAPGKYLTLSISGVLYIDVVNTRLEIHYA